MWCSMKLCKHFITFKKTTILFCLALFWDLFIPVRVYALQVGTETIVEDNDRTSLNKVKRFMRQKQAWFKTRNCSHVSLSNLHIKSEIYKTIFWTYTLTAVKNRNSSCNSGMAFRKFEYFPITKIWLFSNNENLIAMFEHDRSCSNIQMTVLCKERV